MKKFTSLVPYLLLLTGCMVQTRTKNNAELAPSSPCAITLNPTAAHCSRLLDTVPIGDDGTVITEGHMSSRVVLQYCEGKVCNSPFIMTTVPIIVGPNRKCGGLPVNGKISSGILYVLREDRENLLTTSDAAGKMRPEFHVKPK